MNKKGQAINQLQGLIAPLIGVCVVLVVGFLIFAQVKTQIQARAGTATAALTRADTTYGVAYNATETVASAMDDIPGWLPIIIITVVGAILLALVSIFVKRG